MTNLPPANPPWADLYGLELNLPPLHAQVVPVLLTERLCNPPHVLCKLEAAEVEMSSYFWTDQTL